MDWAIATLSLFLALVLAVAAAHKLVARDRLAAAGARLAQVPAVLGLPLILAAALVEAMAAVALVGPGTRPAGALAAAVLWSGYGFALLAARRRGESGADCGCSFAPHRSGIDRFAVGRAFGLGLLALALVPAAGGVAFTIEPLFAAVAFYTLFLAAGELAAVPRLGREALR